MTRHTVKPKTVHPSPRGAKKLGTCAVCGPETEVVWNGLSWRCIAAEKAKKVQNRATDRKRAVRAKKTAKKRNSDMLAYIWRQIVFERAGRCCEICGAGPFEKGDFRLQGHHLVKRSQSKRLQLDPQNGAALCPGCHLSADRDPIRCLALVEKRDPGLTAYLFAERLKTERHDPDFTRKRLLETAEIYKIVIE